MNEHFNTNSTRHGEARSNDSEQLQLVGEQRERNHGRNVAQMQQGGLDTGARGWRYAYQGKRTVQHCGLDTGARGWRYAYQMH